MDYYEAIKVIVHIIKIEKKNLRNIMPKKKSKLQEEP